MPTIHNDGIPMPGNGAPSPAQKPVRQAPGYFHEIHQLRQQNEQSLQYIHQHQQQQQMQNSQFGDPRVAAFYVAPSSFRQHPHTIAGSYALQYPPMGYATPHTVRRPATLPPPPPVANISIAPPTIPINPNLSGSASTVNRDHWPSEASTSLRTAIQMAPPKVAPPVLPSQVQTVGNNNPSQGNNAKKKVKEDKMQFLAQKKTVQQNSDPISAKKGSDVEVRKNLEPEAVQHAFAVPSDIAEIVALASSLVGEEIRLCHYGHNGFKMTNSGMNPQAEARIRARSASSAIEEFANTIVLQNILAANSDSIQVCNDPIPIDPAVAKALADDSTSNNSRNAKGKERDHRIFIATLMSLREIMAMNAQEIFGFTDEEDGYAEGLAIKVTSLATALVLNAISRLDHDSLQITEKFLTAISEYDDGDEAFASCLKRLDVRAIAITPNGKPMKKQESLAYRASYNVSRLEHPLIRKQIFSVEPPPSNAAFVSIVEQIHSNTDDGKTQIARKAEVLERYRKKMKKFY